MTPSGWHDDAKNRDAGHDEMQAAVYRWLRKQSRAPHERKKNYGDRSYTVTRAEFMNDIVEASFIDGNRIVCFADVCRSWKITETDYRLGLKDEWVIGKTDLKGYVREIYEIKPKIYSAGAATRQLITLDYLVSNIKYKMDYTYATNHVRATLVVPWDDPKASLCGEFGCDVLLWDGDRPRSDNEPCDDGADTTF